MSTEYPYCDDAASFTAAYLLPAVERLVRRVSPAPERIFELGCGSGATARHFASLGYEVTGVDPSASGISFAPTSSVVHLARGSSDDDLALKFGTFRTVISLEVIEHCVSVRQYADCLRSLVSPGGAAIISTPYHGYLKNLVVVASGRFDHHFDPLWEGGHLHFFSIPKLRAMFLKAGFSSTEFYRVGRIPPLAKSVIALAHG
jgi:SAM-dependent methyltransferase